MSLDKANKDWVIEDDERPSRGTGRASTLLNDDDYDYALELSPDEEYRRVAGAVPAVVDFNELVALRRQRNKLSSSSGAFSSSLTEEARPDIDSDDEQFIDDLEGNHEIGAANGALRLVWNGVMRRLRSGSEKLKCDDQVHSQSQQPEASSSSEAAFRLHLENQNSGIDIETGQSIGMVTVSSPTMHRRRSPLQLKSQPRIGISVGEPVSLSFSSFNDSPQRSPNKFIPPAVFLSEDQFVTGMAHLSKRQRWVNASSRRSSIAFLREQGFLSKSASDRLTVALVSGLVVRRHQAHKQAEYVRLYSVDGKKCSELILYIFLR